MSFAATPSYPEFQLPHLQIVQSSFYHKAPPIYFSNDFDLESIVLTKLGSNGSKRLNFFKTAYCGALKGESDAKPLSVRSLQGFSRFIRSMPFSNSIKPSIFLTDEGYLALSWPDSNGKAIDLEFTPAGIHFYLQSTDTEDQISYDEGEIQAFVTALS